jgi:hypothetical protein
MSPLDRAIAVTFFRDFGASRKTEEELSLQQLAPRILASNAPVKKQLPWLKLARFGNVRTEKNSLRHNPNVLAISGIEADYDTEIMSVDEACAVLANARLAAMVYTSPSHTEDAPRWRVLCPFSAEYPPADRVRFLSRLNGVFQGALARESFVLSQSYYFGSENGNPSHRVELVDGDYLDLRPDLDENAIGVPVSEAEYEPIAYTPGEGADRYVDGVIRNVLGKVASAGEGQKHYTIRNQAMILGGYMHIGNYGVEEAASWLVSALPASVRDPKAAHKTALWGIERGAMKPLNVPERKSYTNGHANGHAPTPEPPSAGDNNPPPDNVVQLKPKKQPKPRPARPDDWRKDWHVSDEGTALPSLFNAMVAMRQHPALAGVTRFDEMERSEIIAEQIPGTPFDPTIPRIIRDCDVIAIQEELQQIGLRRIAKATVQDAVHLRANQMSFHPVKDYLNGLVWDKKSRLDSWLSYYLGAEPQDGENKEKALKYIFEVGRLFLIGLVARVLRPGCKADYMLILEGPQGALKSSACRVLAGEWFSDNLPDLSRGDAVRLSMHLRGKWLIEIAEMSSFNAAEAHTLKEFLTQTEERYTPKFGRNEVKEARQCLFVGTTNEQVYLRDATGARRFWPVRVGTINLTDLQKDRDQLLAEAVSLFNAGQPWWPEQEFEKATISPEQEQRFEHDPWEGPIQDWIAEHAIESCNMTSILRHAIGLGVEKHGTRDIRRVTAIMRRLKWTRNMNKHGRPYEKPQKI